VLAVTAAGLVRGPWDGSLPLHAVAGGDDLVSGVAAGGAFYGLDGTEPSRVAHREGRVSGPPSRARRLSWRTASCSPTPAGSLAQAGGWSRQRRGSPCPRRSHVTAWPTGGAGRRFFDGGLASAVRGCSPLLERGAGLLGWGQALLSAGGSSWPACAGRRASTAPHAGGRAWRGVLPRRNHRWRGDRLAQGPASGRLLSAFHGLPKPALASRPASCSWERRRASGRWTRAGPLAGGDGSKHRILGHRPRRVRNRPLRRDLGGGVVRRRASRRPGRRRGWILGLRPSWRRDRDQHELS
jgi:hypothetical protein